MKARNEYFDFLRGVAIMMVVAIHTLPAITGYNSLREDIILLLRQVMNCAVPVFLAISGYFMARKTLDSRGEILSFWRKQMPRVFIPMVVWSLGWFGFSLFKVQGIEDVGIRLGMLFTGGFSVYYFVTLIMQCYIALPLLTKFKSGGVICCAILSFLAIIITNYYMYIEGNQFPLILYAGPIYLWIVFFMLGIYQSKYPDRPYLYWGIILIIVGLVLQIVESYYLLRNFETGIGIKTSSFIFSIGVILSIMSIQAQNAFRSSKLTRGIAWIGEVSFGIYLIHTYSIAIFSRLLDTDNWGVMWALSLVLTMAIIIIMQKIVPAPILKKYYGF